MSEIETAVLKTQMENITTGLDKLVGVVEKGRTEDRAFQREMLDKIYDQGKVIEQHTLTLEQDKKKIDSMQIKVDNLEALKNKVYGWSVAFGFIGGGAVVSAFKVLGVFAR